MAKLLDDGRAGSEKILVDYAANGSSADPKRLSSTAARTVAMRCAPRGDHRIRCSFCYPRVGDLVESGFRRCGRSALEISRDTMRAIAHMVAWFIGSQTMRYISNESPFLWYVLVS